MIHILFHNTLFLDVTRYKQVFVDKDLQIIFLDTFTYHYTFNDGYGDDHRTKTVDANSIKLPILSHPTVKSILANVPDEQKEDTKKAIVYQVFNMLCQRFTGKSLVDGVLIPIENDVLNLDGALRNLRVNEEEKKDGEGNK